MLLKILVLKLQKPLWTARTQQEMQPWKFLQWGNWTLSSPSFQTEQISQEKKNYKDFWIFLNILLTIEVQEVNATTPILIKERFFLLKKSQEIW